jgi:glycosyltransferase involved in cell wall biosynthesis
MPMYNAAAYADEAIRSIRDQTLADFDLLIIDDGSSDGSAQIAQQHALDDKRLIFHSIAHAGISHAMNFGLARARGEYVAIMHADDVASQNRFERQIQFLDANDDIGALGTAYRLVSQSGKVIAKIGNPQRPDECRAALLAGDNCICNHSVMVRRRAFERAGPYVQELWPSEDYAKWLRISEFTGVANLNECL